MNADAARLDNCNLTFDSDRNTRPIRGRGHVALVPVNVPAGVRYMFQFEISSPDWVAGVLYPQLHRVRVEEVRAETDGRKTLVAQWRQNAFPDQRQAFCRLTIKSRHASQFHQALLRVAKG